MTDKKNKQKLYRLTVTERALFDIAAAVEDYHRFLCGQVGMSNACIYLAAHIPTALEDRVKAITHPDLAPNASFSWCGGGCEDEALKAAIIRTYPLYREIFHHFAVKYGVDNVYRSRTLTCEGQEPITIEEVGEEPGDR